MYKIEIFDTNMDYISACYTDDSQAISLDYLAFDPFQLTIQLVDAKKGYFAHITDDEGNLIGDCIISDVKPQKSLQNVSLRPIQAIFDREVFYSPVSDAITWIATNLDDVYVSTSDVLQRLPLNITYTVGSRNFPLTGYNLNPTINILSVITNAFATWDVVTNAWMDLVNKEIRVDIFEQTATQTIECDLENIISSEVTLGDSYGSTNKLTIKKTVAEGTPSGTTEITYYLHTDGTIDTTDTDRITPVFFDAETLEQTDEMTDAEWIAETEVMAKETLTPAQYDNEVVLMVWGDDKIINPRDIELGTITTLYIKGEVYYSILTGVAIEGGMFTLTFGAVRTELTKKLSIEKRNSGSVSHVSGGGGGGGGDVPIATTTTPGIVMPDGTTITVEADGTIHAVGGGGGEGGGLSIVEVWTNSSPNASFSAQTISVSLSEYSSVIIVAKTVANSSIYTARELVKGTMIALSEWLGSQIGRRDFTWNDNGLVCSRGIKTTNVTALTEDNTVIIPYKIIGVKGGGGGSSISYFNNQVVSVASNAEILRITDASITSSTVVLECTFADPSYISGSVSWTSSNGYISFIGTCTSATTANITLGNVSTSTANVPIKQMTMTGTTTSTGAFSTGQTYKIVNAVSSVSYALCLPRGDGYIQVINPSNMTGLANTNMTITFYYIEE